MKRKRSGKQKNPKIKRRRTFNSQRIAKENKDMLFDAVRRGDCPKVKAILKNYREFINSQDELGNTPLHKAVAIHRDNNDVIKLLLKKGADPNIKNNEGQTPLHETVWGWRLSYVKLLVQYGADVIAKNNRNKSPIEYATTLETQEYLIEKGSRVYDHPERRLHYALSYHYGTHNSNSSQKESIIVPQFFVKQGADVTAKLNSRDENAIQIAEKGALPEVVKYLNKVKSKQDEVKKLIQNLQDFLELSQLDIEYICAKINECIYRGTGGIIRDITESFKEHIKNFCDNIHHDVQKIMTLSDDEYTPVYILQEALVKLVEIYKKHPGAINKWDIISLCKKIPFNNRFINDATYDYSGPHMRQHLDEGKFKDVRIFIVKNHHLLIKDSNNLEIMDACLHYWKEPLNQYAAGEVFSQILPTKTKWRTVTKENLLDIVENIDIEKREKNEPFYQYNFSMQYLIYLFLKSKTKLAIPEIAAQIISFLDHRSARDIVKQFIVEQGQKKQKIVI